MSEINYIRDDAEMTDQAEWARICIAADPQAILESIAGSLPQEHLVIDCTEIEVMPSVAIASLIRVVKGCKELGYHALLVGVGSRLHAVFQAFRLQLMLPICADLPAVASYIDEHTAS